MILCQIKIKLIIIIIISTRDFTKKFIFLKAFSLDISYIEVWFTDQNSKPLEVKDKINITLVIS